MILVFRIKYIKNVKLITHDGQPTTLDNERRLAKTNCSMYVTQVTQIT